MLAHENLEIRSNIRFTASEGYMIGNTDSELGLFVLAINLGRNLDLATSVVIPRSLMPLMSSSPTWLKLRSLTLDRTTLCLPCGCALSGHPLIFAASD